MPAGISSGRQKSQHGCLRCSESCKVVLGVLGSGLHGHITRLPASRADLEQRQDDCEIQRNTDQQQLTPDLGCTMMQNKLFHETHINIPFVESRLGACSQMSPPPTKDKRKAFSGYINRPANRHCANFFSFFHPFYFSISSAHA